MPVPAWTTHLGFAALCAAATISRRSVLLDPAAPSGADGGNWLAFGHDLLGHHVRSTSISYPPLVPLLVLVAVWAFGLTAGFTVVALASALAPGVATYGVLRSLGLGWKAGLPAGFLVVAASTGEPVAWGGYPQLLGIGLTIGLLWALDRYLRTGERRIGAFVGAFAFAVLATSHLLATAAVVAVVVLIALHLTIRPSEAAGPSTRELVTWLGLSVAPCLLLLPLYLHLGDTVLRGFATRPAVDRLDLDGILRALRALLGDLPGVWRNATILAALTPLLLLRRRQSSLWMLATATVVAVAVLVLVSREVRFLYLVPPAVVIGLACWIDELGRSRDGILHRLGQAIIVAIVIAVAIEAAHEPRYFRAHREYYKMLTPALVEGIEWVRDNTPSDAVVAVGAIKGVPLGWWVEGLGERHTLLDSDPRWLYFPDERVRAEEAFAVFNETFPSAATLLSARARGVGWILVPKISSDYGRARPRLEALEATMPTLIAFENRDTVVLRVP